MKRFWSGVIAATFAATVGVAAQGSPTSQGAGAQPGSQASAQKVTISGCIQNAPAASATASAGGAKAEAGGAAEGARASASAGTQNFVLANAKMASGSGAGSAGAVGTTGTAATRYELDGDVKAIQPHLNHQVEITGTVQSSSTSAGQTSSTAGTRAAAAPRLKVDSVKMVSATCP